MLLLMLVPRCSYHVGKLEEDLFDVGRLRRLILYYLNTCQQLFIWTAVEDG